MDHEYKTSTGVPLKLIKGFKKDPDEVMFDLPKGTKIVSRFKFKIPWLFHYETVTEIMPHENKPTKHEFLQWLGGIYVSKTMSRW